MFKCMPFLACNRQVDSLDKRQCNLKDIPEDVGRYARSLEELMLDSNHITELSKPLFRLVKLRRLLLSDNEIFKIPAAISSLQNLVDLDLSKNDISDIPENIKFCKNLRILNLGSNPITRLPASISQLRSLTHLGLSDVSLTQLPNDIGNLSNLRELELRENLLKNLPQSIAFLTLLQRLDLGANELSELPAEIGQLNNLQELYIDTNDLAFLPRDIGNLTRLQVLDVSENRLEAVPEELGDLIQLTDLTLSQNSLESLPHSIGRLKKLTICKVDKNRLIQLTPAIGSCTAMQELILTENLISEFPSSIGNLKQMTNLNIDKNAIIELPSTIGSCSSLGVLSARDNQLDSLPMEIGKLENLRVLDVSGNRLPYLPFTVGVLAELQALWLSENQSQPLLKLQTDQDPKTGIKVLTCYLLPQRDQAGNPAVVKDKNLSPDHGGDGPVGGPNVHWVDEGINDDEERRGVGNFRRQDTPHPKPGLGMTAGHGGGVLNDKHSQGRSTNGHCIIPHNDHKDESRRENLENQQSNQQSLPLLQHESTQQSSATKPPVPLPRRTSPSTTSNDLAAAPSTSSENLYHQDETIGKSVGFAENSRNNEDDEDEEQRSNRLQRKNTPHYLKHTKIELDAVRTTVRPSTTVLQQIMDNNQHSQNGNLNNQPQKGPQQNGNFSTTLIGVSQPAKISSGGGGGRLISVYEEQTRPVARLAGSLGLSIAGGVDSPPFNAGAPDDDEGIFISKLTEGGPADRAGLKQGDRLLAINGNSTVGVSHSLAVDYMKRAGDQVAMKIGRTVLKPASLVPDGRAQNNDGSLSSTGHSPDVSFTSSSAAEARAETIATSVTQDMQNGPGFSIAGGKGSTPFLRRNGDEGIFISYITPGGNAEREGQIKVGDRVLSINGTNMKAGRHDQAVALLTSYETEVHLVVSRGLQIQNTTRLMTPQSPTSTASTSITNNIPEAPLAQSSPINTLLKYRLSGSDEIGIQDYATETITLSKKNGPLGLTIVGGRDHDSSQPFGAANQPGVFVSKITAGGNAEKTGKVRVGDRILSVNGADIQKAEHHDVVKLLQAAKNEVRLQIRHDPQPRGLTELHIQKRGSEPLGVSIFGGVESSPPVNPSDSTDEGIFVEDVHRAGAAGRDGRLKSGMRLLEVNDVSLLGCTQEEAAKILKNAGTSLKLVVCDGFDPQVLPNTLSPSQNNKSPSPNTTSYNSYKSAQPECPPSYSTSPTALQPFAQPNDRLATYPDGTTNNSSSSSASSTRDKIISDHRLNTSDLDVGGAATNNDPRLQSRLPSATVRSSATAGKSIVCAAASAAPSTAPSSGLPEKLSFGSKIKRFQQEIAEQSQSAAAAAANNPTKKFHLVNDSDMRRIRLEEEVPKIINSSRSAAVERPAVVRTKKAENRLLAATTTSTTTEDAGPTSKKYNNSTITNILSPSAEQRAHDAQKRAEWRAARLKSLESDALKAEQVLQNVMMNTSTPDIIEESPEDFPPPSPSALAVSDSGESPSVNGKTVSTRTETTEEKDPATGDRIRRTVQITRRTLTAHQVESSTKIHDVPEIPEIIDFIDAASSIKS